MKSTTLASAMLTVSAYEYERLCTHQSEVIGLLYEQYLSNEPLYRTEYDRELKTISDQTAKLAEMRNIDVEALGELEGAATQAGFWAGFLAGEAYARFLQKREAIRSAG